MELLAFWVLGIAIGAFGTLVGIGGGFFLVPFFILVLHWSPQHAVGTSLFVVFLNAVSGSFAYIKQKKVYYDAALRFSLATLPGSIIGSYMVQYFSGNGFHIIFGIALLLLALFMVFHPSVKGVEENFQKESFSYNRPLGIGISVIVGFLSSMLGIGGGLIHVPAMVYLLLFPAHIATATSHFVLAISTFFGVTSHLLLGHVLLLPAITIGTGAVIGAQAGAKLSLKVKSRRIILLLSFALFSIGLRLVWI